MRRTRQLYGTAYVDTKVIKKKKKYKTFFSTLYRPKITACTYFRSTFLGITIVCILCTVVLIWFVHKNRRIKVFRIASPTFLIITLIGCIIMYLEVNRTIIFKIKSTFYVLKEVALSRSTVKNVHHRHYYIEIYTFFWIIKHLQVLITQTLFLKNLSITIFNKRRQSTALLTSTYCRDHLLGYR